MLRKTTLIFILVYISYNSNSKELLSGRIINGKRAFKGQFLWHVRLRVKLHKLCGGSIISSKWILTAAHCIKNVKYVKIEYGSIYRKKPKYSVKSSKLIKHPNYGAHSKRDIGLVKLSRPIKYNEYIKPVLLPPKSMTKESIVGKVCTVCGFGVYTPRRKLISNYLRYALVRTISRDVCEYKSSPEGVICVKPLKDNQKRNVCYGDSGGGLILTKNDKKYIIGVASFVYRGCIKKSSAFQSVHWNLNWISKTTGIKIEN